MVMGFDFNQKVFIFLESIKVNPTLSINFQVNSGTSPMNCRLIKWEVSEVSVKEKSLFHIRDGSMLRHVQQSGEKRFSS